MGRLAAKFENLDIKTKIVAMSLFLFLSAIWLLAHDVADEVRDDFKAVVSTQQSTLVDHITDSLEEEAKLRINSLNDLSSIISTEITKGAEQTRTALQQYKHIDRLFNIGVVVIRNNGSGLADYPHLIGRDDYSFKNDDFFKMVMGAGSLAISKPRQTPFTDQPVIVLAVPIYGQNKEIVGVLAGYNSVSGSDFFTEIIPKRNNLGSEFHIISARDKIFVASTNPRRILQTTSERGKNIMFDRFIDGFEGSGIGVNSEGKEMLFSSMRIPSTGWLVVASTPTETAFEPILDLEIEIYKDAAVASLIIALVIWFFIHRQLAPLGRSARILDDMASGNLPLSPLPEEGSLEIRRLLCSFNKFQQRISEQKRSLRENAEQLSLAASVFDGTSEAIAITDAENRIIRVNKSFCQLTGYEQEELTGQAPNLLKSGRHDAAFYAAMWEALDATGEWSGEIWNRRKNGEIYPERLSISTIHNNDGSVRHRIAIASDITAQKHADDIIWQQANYDLLTYLPNRRLVNKTLLENLLEARISNDSVAILLIDLDHFKEVNDTLGHAVGDRLLIETANRIRACVPPADTVGHLGADEFIVILAGLPDLADLESVAEDIRKAIAQPYGLGGETVFLTATIGITAFPTDGGTIDELFRNADQATREAKAGGRNWTSAFTESMRQTAQTRLQIASDLKGALAAGQLQVYYQPIVAMPSRQIVKAEALIRWRHPERGFISPALFIPIAEETGLITEIGDWVFRQAAAMARRLCDRCAHMVDGACCNSSASGPPKVCPFQIGVNKSPRQFFSGSSHKEWVAHLKELNISPRCITIEVTEGLLLDHHGEVIERLKKFREAGMQISLDDFGTGYSAMSYLKKFDIDIIKIDQSFVRDMTIDSADCAIAEAIIVMAHRLGMKVVAEGIETEEQYNLLLAAGCDYGQGYLFAKPMPAEPFLALVAPPS